MFWCGAMPCSHSGRATPKGTSSSSTFGRPLPKSRPATPQSRPGNSPSARERLAQPKQPTRSISNDSDNSLGAARRERPAAHSDGSPMRASAATCSSAGLAPRCPSYQESRLASPTGPCRSRDAGSASLHSRARRRKSPPVSPCCSAALSTAGGLSGLVARARPRGLLRRSDSMSEPRRRQGASSPSEGG